MSKFDFIIGVDQTGALKANKKKEPKPLPVAVLRVGKRKKWLLHNFSKDEKPLYLKKFRISCIEDLLKNEFSSSIKESRIFVCVDTVIGFPKSLGASSNLSALGFIRSFLKSINMNEGYGAKVAEDFFSKFLKEYSNLKLDSYPKRKVEVDLGANSIFQSRPYQKNIQTGSYRILKELSEEDHAAYSLLPFQNLKIAKGKPVICEGYPSYSWKVLNKSLRTAEDFSQVIKIMNKYVDGFSHLKKISSDHKDATFLALHALYKIKKGFIENYKPSKSFEGGILGKSF